MNDINELFSEARIRSLCPDERIGRINSVNNAGTSKERRIQLNLKTTANTNESMPATAAVESIGESLINDVKLYEVRVAADLQLSLRAYVNIYATDADEAEEKVQAKIDDEMLGDLEMEDPDSGVTIPYSHVRHCSGDFYTDSAEVVEHNVDPADLLEAEVEQLQARITWNTDTMAKHKAFLELMLNNGDEEQAVAA